MKEFPSLIVHVRHAEPDVPHPDVSDRNLPLSERGNSHMQCVGERMYKRFGTFDCIICSEFERSRQTMRHIMKPYTQQERNRTVIIEQPLLNERSQGKIFGLNPEMVEKQYPEFARERRRLGEIKVIYPEGESLWRVFFRVRALTEVVLPLYHGERVCLVGHWGTSFGLRQLWEKLTDEQILQAMAYEHPPYGSLLVFEPHNGSIALREKNLLLCNPPN